MKATKLTSSDISDSLIQQQCLLLILTSAFIRELSPGGGDGVGDSDDIANGAYGTGSNGDDGDSSGDNGDSSVDNGDGRIVRKETMWKRGAVQRCMIHAVNDRTALRDGI